MRGETAVISALVWTKLSEQERDWLSLSFYIVGLRVAAVDGQISPEEIDLLQRSVVEIAKGTKSYVLAQAAARFLQEQRLAEYFFPPTRLSPAEGARRIEEVVGGARSVIAKLPEEDRHQFGAALVVTGVSMMDTKGSKKADHLAAAGVFDATAEALGINVEADLAWIEAQRPRDPARGPIALLAGLAWIVSGALMGYLALPSFLANTGNLGAIGNVLIAFISLYIGGRIALLQVGFTGIADATARQAAQRAVWNGMLAATSAVGVPTDILAASVLWGILSVPWQGYQIAQGLTNPAYVGAALAAALGLFLSLVARAQRRSPKAR